MNRILWVWMALSLGSVQADNLGSAAQGQLGNWSVRSGDGDTLTIYERLEGTQGTLIALGASNSQEGGQAQQKAFLSTHQQLAERGFELPPIAHLNIIAGPPRLVQGFIRRGIVREYADPVQPGDIWLMFPDDYSDYEQRTGLVVSDRGHWVWVNSEGHILWSIEQQGEQTLWRLLEQLSE